MIVTVLLASPSQTRPSRAQIQKKISRAPPTGRGVVRDVGAFPTRNEAHAELGLSPLAHARGKFGATPNAQLSVDDLAERRNRVGRESELRGDRGPIVSGLEQLRDLKLAR